MKRFLFFFLLLFCVHLPAQERADSAFIFQQNHYQDTLAPHFSLVDLQGNLWDSDSLRGKVIVLNFWSVYCPPCFVELPELNQTAASFSPDSIIFISVLFEKGAHADSVVRKNEFSYHLVMGGLPIMSDYYNNCFPTHIIIDREGMIRYNVCGMLNREVLLPEIRSVVKKQN